MNVSRWKARIEKIEQQVGVGKNQGAEMIWLMPNDGGDEAEETIRSVRLAHGIWAKAWCGPPYSAEQIAALKSKYGGLSKEEMAEMMRVPIEWLDVYAGKNREPQPPDNEFDGR